MPYFYFHNSNKTKKPKFVITATDCSYPRREVCLGRRRIKSVYPLRSQLGASESPHGGSREAGFICSWLGEEGPAWYPLQEILPPNGDGAGGLERDMRG